ncbi:MAG: YitT family protein [Lachnospiraceae bacterium]|jgi:uncharacterized membrane protein YczE|nr:YitT family protein [Lachnospiraceae bacterium]MCI8996194.1 YitT family protein [Lachnospiraceae bacterium]MCI9134564.1 YitT family protein [Lachnospiraceae bacterium]
MTKQKERIRRYLLFMIGLFINSLGVTLVTRADLGTSPISSIPYVLSLGFAPSLGTFTLYMSLFLIALQLLILGRSFPRQYLLQLPVSFLFSYFIDFSMKLLAFLKPDHYAQKLLLLLVGCFVLGFGVFIEVAANVVMLPGECFVNAVSMTYHTDFGKTKIIFDSSLAALAIGISLLLYGKVNGVREGTLIAAVLVGMIARLLKQYSLQYRPILLP